MAELDFLDTVHDLYAAHMDEWRRNERRAFGNAAEDLMPFVGENPDFLKLRQERASFVNFMQSHALAVTGHLRQFGAPKPGSSRFSMGTLGEPRPIQQVRRGGPLGERIYYSVDAAGDDGNEWPVFFDGVDERSQYTGHRGIYCETPPTSGLEVSQADAAAGVRAFLQEYSPLEETMWLTRYGTRQFTILRIHTDSGRVVDGQWVPPANETPNSGDPLPGRGYYLLVRAGYTGLGPRFVEGGWWLYDAKKTLLGHRPWGRALRGAIPYWHHYGEWSKGTVQRPALSRSPTEPLGRVAVSLMDVLSARDWDAIDAARSGKWFSPGTKDVMKAIKEQWDNKSLHIGVPAAFDENTAQSIVVQMMDDSSGAVAPAVFQAIIDAKFAEAREQSFQALTSLPGSSGVSKERGFEDVKAPYLGHRATYRQQSEGKAIWALEARMGKDPTGFCAYEEQYTLEPVVDDIDRAFQTLRLNQMRSPALEPAMAIAAIKDRLGGSLPDGVKEADVLRELRTSSQTAVTADAQASQLATAFGQPAAGEEGA